MIILGIDPGTTNTGVTLIKFKNENDFKVIDSFLMKGTIANVITKLSKLKFDVVGIESYVFYGTPTNSEKVNRLIGAIEYMAMAKKKKVTIMKAVDWQTFVRFHFKLKKVEVGKSFKKLAVRLFNLKFKTEHQADAFFIALVAGIKEKGV